MLLHKINKIYILTAKLHHSKTVSVWAFFFLLFLLFLLHILLIPTFVLQWFGMLLFYHLEPTSAWDRSQAPDCPEDRAGLHWGPRRAQRRGQRPHGTVGPRLRPQLGAGRVRPRELRLEPAVDSGVWTTVSSRAPGQAGAWVRSSRSRQGTGMIPKEQKKWDPLHFPPWSTALAPYLPRSSASRPQTTCWAHWEIWTRDQPGSLAPRREH